MRRFTARTISAAATAARAKVGRARNRRSNSTSHEQGSKTFLDQACQHQTRMMCMKRRTHWLQTFQTIIGCPHLSATTVTCLLYQKSMYVALLSRINSFNLPKIRYQNLSYVVNVSKTQHDINTVATAAVRAATFSSMRAANRCEFSVLDDLTGEIRPGTTTLVMFSSIVAKLALIAVCRSSPLRATERHRCSQRSLDDSITLACKVL